MSLNHRFTTVFVAAVSSVIGASVVGCEGAAGPCDTDFDCGANFTCDDGTCTPKTGGGGGGGGGNEGEGEGEVAPELVQLDNPVSMFIPGTDIGEPANIAVVGEYESGVVDQVRFFDVVTGVLETSPGDFDFLNNSIGEPGGCNIDAMSVERGVDPSDLADEYWFSCQLSGVESARTDDLVQSVAVRSGVGADLIVRLEQDDEVNGVTARRMYAKRGTRTLTVEQVEEDLLDRPDLRALDTVEVAFGKIAGLFLVTESNNLDFGDIVLVFDRAYPGAAGKPALVPIERSPNFSDTEAWVAAHTPWAPIVLPDDTHAVRVGSIPDPNVLVINEVDQATQNLAVFLPTEGVVGFGRMESMMLSGDTMAADGTGTGFNALLFDTDVPNAAPDPELRILLTDVPGAADTVFYVLRGAVRSYGWKMKLHVGVNDDFSNDVERARFLDESRDDPNGIVTIPGVDDAAWISLKSDTVLERLPFDVAF